MRNSLTCATSIQNSKSSDIARTMASVCGMLASSMSTNDPCAEISSSPGTYGRYSFCSELDKLSYVMNKYVAVSGGSCDFRGLAKSVNPKNRLDALADCGNSTDDIIRNDKAPSSSPNQGFINSSSLFSVLLAILALIQI
jgi:hypothetical protein